MCSSMVSVELVEMPVESCVRKLNNVLERTYAPSRNLVHACPGQCPENTEMHLSLMPPQNSDKIPQSDVSQSWTEQKIGSVLITVYSLQNNITYPQGPVKLDRVRKG